LKSPLAPLVPSVGNPNSYNGLIVLATVLAALATTRIAVGIFANRTTRRSAAWDCGYPDASPATQYTAGSYAEPIRRVFGTIAFGARETVHMPKPGDLAPASFHLTLPDPVWDRIYVPIAGIVASVADRMNVLQFLTIRRYLTLVFITLVVLLLVLALWI
jgi:hypothetical protein